MANYPSWAAEVVWYQIFPDRFCRVNPENPISAENLLGTTPWNLDSDDAWQIHPWTSDWYARQPYEKENTKNLKTNILRRRYCGDINGIISKLGYLQDLGVTALYINPMQYSPSLHKYDGTNFLHSDPFLGSNPSEDILLIENEDFNDFENACWTTADMETLKLISEAHAHGMKIIFDGVFNHIGYNSKQFQDVLKKRQKSPYSQWFIVDYQKSTPKKLCYEKFWGCVNEMPKLNYGCQDVKKYVFATLKRWLKPIVNGIEFEGIDGWRIDHAIGVPATFWAVACQFVKSVKPDSLFLAELIEPLHVVKPYLDNGCFDSVMNYGFYYAACQFFAAEKNAISSLKFDNELRSQLKLFNTDANFLMMNLLGTHDSERIASYIVNRNLKKFGTQAEFWENSHVEDKKYTSRKPNELERKIQCMMIVFEFSMIGSPAIYYGDELGMWGANDPDCRKPMMWPDMKFEDEHLVTGNRHLKKFEKIEPDFQMLDFYKKIISLRKKYPCLSHGKFVTYFSSGEKRVYVYSREDQNNTVLFAFNRESEACDVSLDISVSKQFSDYFSGKIFKSKSEKLSLNLEPYSFKILVN